MFSHFFLHSLRQIEKIEEATKDEEEKNGWKEMIIAWITKCYTEGEIIHNLIMVLTNCKERMLWILCLIFVIF